MKSVIRHLVAFVVLACSLHAATVCHSLDHPDSATLARVRQFDTAAEPALGVGMVRRTPAQQKAWEQAEIAAGWVPVPVAPTPEQQAAADAEAAELALIAQLAAECEAMIAGTGTQAERQRRVELWLGRLGKRLLKKGVIP